MSTNPAVRRNIDLLGAVLLAVCCVVVDLVVHVVAVRAILAVPLCLLLPGYVWTVAIFGRLQRERAATLMLVCALSLVALVLGGLLLNETPWGIRAGTWAALLLLLIAGGAAVAWHRREVASEDGEVVRAAGALPRTLPLRSADLVGLVIVAVVAIGALAASRLPLGAVHANGYESLALRATDHNRAVDVELLSARQHTTSYSLAVTVGTTLITRRTVRLGPGAGVALRVLVGSSARTRMVAASAVMAGAGHLTRSVDIALGAS